MNRRTLLSMLAAIPAAVGGYLSKHESPEPPAAPYTFVDLPVYAPNPADTKDYAALQLEDLMRIRAYIGKAKPKYGVLVRSMKMPPDTKFSGAY